LGGAAAPFGSSVEGILAGESESKLIIEEMRERLERVVRVCVFRCCFCVSSAAFLGTFVCSRVDVIVIVVGWKVYWGNFECELPLRDLLLFWL
jgi:hypothetical protein